MKKKTSCIAVVSLVAVLLISNIAVSQKEGSPPPPPRPNKEKKGERQMERRENIETMKIGFITKKLDLTPEEAEKFWPVYNQYNNKLQDIRKKRREDFRDAKQKFDALSDKEVEVAIDNEMASRQKELDIQKEYHEKFKTVLSIKKVARLYEAEEQFKMELLNKLKDKKELPPPRGAEGPPNPPRDKE